MSERPDSLDPTGPDAALDALYRRASTEEPGAALDAAIRAAARRTVHAAPVPMAGSARRAPPRWWSAAAAATIAAVAFAIVQLAPVESTDDAGLAREESDRADHPRTAEPPTSNAKSSAETRERADHQRTAEPPTSTAGAAAETREPSYRQQMPEPSTSTAQAPVEKRERAASNAGAHVPLRSPERTALPSAKPPEREQPARREPKAFPDASTGTLARAPVPSESGASASDEATAPSAAAPQAQRAPQPRAAAASPVPPEPSFEAWVERIEALLRSGHPEDARRELLLLRERYPDRERALSPELKALLPER